MACCAHFAPQKRRDENRTSEHLRLSSDLARAFLIGLGNLNYKQPVHRSPTVLACHRLNGPTRLNEPTRYVSAQVGKVPRFLYPSPPTGRAWRSRSPFTLNPCIESDQRVRSFDGTRLWRPHWQKLGSSLVDRFWMLDLHF